MEIHEVIQRQRFRRFLLLLIFFLLILLPLGCGDDTASVSDSKRSSATLMIRWNNTSKLSDSSSLRADQDCPEGDVENVVCQVYDANGDWLISGGPWSYSDHSGRVDNIPVGQDRSFVVLAEDVDGNIICQGETFGITINPDEIQDVEIDASPFLPTLSAPDDGDQQVNPNGCSLEWDPVQNADGYIVQVAEDIDFQTIIVDASTAETTYTPSALQSLTEYFWKISAKDLYGNIGADSEVRRFITTFSDDDATTSLSGTVVDASTAEPISGAAISVGEGTYTTTTNTAGQYRFENIIVGSYAVSASMSGYTSSTESVALEEGNPSTLNFALSETIVNSDEYRIVLTWVSTPRDLDSHIWTPDGGHVCYYSMGSEIYPPYTQLDVDDMTSGGPETITIYQAQDGTYTYAVHNFSYELTISDSGATVEVYGESGLIQKWDVPDGDGRWWNVFTLDGNTGQIDTINSISDTAP